MDDLNLDALMELSDTVIDVAEGVQNLAEQLSEYRDRLRDLGTRAADYSVAPGCEQAKRDLVFYWREMVASLDAALAALGGK